MKKIFLIINREYLSRVKKKSFIIMTILGPILMASIIIVPIFIAQQSEKEKTIGIVDETTILYDKIPNTDNLKFKYLDPDIIKAKEEFFESDLYAILYIPDVVINSPNTVKLWSDKQPSLNVITYIENCIKKEIESMKLDASGIDKEILASIKTNVTIKTIKLKKSGLEEQTHSGVSTALGFFAGILIYFFIFMYGTQVMRGVIEEKTSRIVEIIVSSVKPFQLMMGKIVGIALVGLTQFALWVLLTFTLISIVQISFPDIFKPATIEQTSVGNSKMLNTQELQQFAKNKEAQISEVNRVFDVIGSINFGLMISAFIFFFLGGYLLYAALFAAIGAAVDSEADTQQFMLPITIPLVFSFIMAQFIINDPESPVAFWFSIIPFTSPIIMMIRIPFGVSDYELTLSVIFLILGFLATTWVAAKIYRTGILMYGKKVNYRELWKWLSYKS